MIVSSISGRLRLRHRDLRDADRLASLRAGIAALSGVIGVETNPRTGSLLVLYDVTRAQRADFEVRVREVAERLVETKRRAQKVGTGGTARVKANRWAKRGMLASLTVSLLLAVVGTKRWHALTGMLFLHALGAHLWVHRRHLFR